MVKLNVKLMPLDDRYVIFKSSCHGVQVDFLGSCKNLRSLCDLGQFQTYRDSTNYAETLKGRTLRLTTTIDGYSEYGQYQPSVMYFSIDFSCQDRFLPPPEQLWPIRSSAAGAAVANQKLSCPLEQLWPIRSSAAGAALANQEPTARSHWGCHWLLH